MKRIALVLSFWIPVACGGSSSETPFPQAPVEPALQARHDAVLAESTADESPDDEAATKPASNEPVVDSSARSATAAETSVSPKPAPSAK